MNALLDRLARSLREIGGSSRETLHSPGFDLFIHPHSDAQHLSFAVPTQGAEPGDIETMRALFTTRRRRARLEFFQERHPGLAVKLEQAGFVCDMRAPVMTLFTADLTRAEAGVQGAFQRLHAQDQVRLTRFLRAQNRAYGGSENSDLDWLTFMTEGLERGSTLAAGLEQGGQLVSGASVQLGADAGELAGVWTRKEKRNRGFAFTLCRQLLSDYFALGHELCWLSAAEGAENLYTRLGFVRCATQLTYAWPDDP